jgi:hypothetical protein
VDKLIYIMNYTVHDALIIRADVYIPGNNARSRGCDIHDQNATFMARRSVPKGAVTT